MSVGRGLRTVVSALVGLGTTMGLAPAQAQFTVGAGVDYMGYAFESGLGVDAAQLLMVPVAVRLPLGGDRVRLEAFSAWAEGRVEHDGTVLLMSGPVDTGVKASIQATPWALVSVGANLPTGRAAHDGEEAIVASVLSTDLLGFREATWGSGLAITTSVATAVTAGGFGVGVAGAYSARSAYEPIAGEGLTYQPGNETRIRLGVDRMIGSGTLSLGGTFIRYDEDRADDRDLFRAGNRLRFDASYAFRAGSSVWTVYAADVIRANGDLRIDVEGGTPSPPGDPEGDGGLVLRTAEQNLFSGGLLGSLQVGGGFVVRPRVDVTVQRRREADGNDSGSGWSVGAGGDIPFRLLGAEVFPKARVFVGAMRDAAGDDVGFVGMEFAGTIRAGF